MVRRHLAAQPLVVVEIVLAPALRGLVAGVLRQHVPERVGSTPRPARRLAGLGVARVRVGPAHAAIRSSANQPAVNRECAGIQPVWLVKRSEEIRCERVSGSRRSRPNRTIIRCR